MNLNELENFHPDHYSTFNTFFSRRLKPGVRPIANHGIVSPVDGKVMALGKIVDGQLIQAKGFYYSLTALLGDHTHQSFQGGDFITLYLSPKDYHRVHSPVHGQLHRTTFIPGRLFSVNPRITRIIPQVFTRNERLVCYIDTTQGPVAVIFVGAMLVGSINTAWQGRVSGKKKDEAVALSLKAGDELGHFEFGSTVILLFPPNTIQPCIRTEETVQVGQCIATYHDRPCD